ncbi:hypothetical protein [Novipirellula artificiosorum]|uniref:hypothetical protein n=1 Tax=Novipirellula artificiosorum TaxID=2528016 RepID=UPI0011B805CA|nr:hypothetical protein [Novipirellula artificiosorum]
MLILLFLATHRHVTCVLFASEDPMRQKDKVERFPAIFFWQLAEEPKNSEINFPKQSSHCHRQTNTLGGVLGPWESSDAVFADRRDFEELKTQERKLRGHLGHLPEDKRPQQ